MNTAHVSSEWTGVYTYRPAAWLRVFGPDAAVFLQGQFTQDLQGLAPGAAAYGLWLDAKGRVQADSFVLRGQAPEEFWVFSYASPGRDIGLRLGAVLVADEVEIADAGPDWGAVTLVGGAQGARTQGGIGYVFEGRRGGAAGSEWVFPLERAGEVAAATAGMRGVGADEIERMRIGAGVPRIPGDLGPWDLPAEGGLEAAAICFTKGCYTGQEVVARLHSRGRVRRRLVRVRGVGPVPSLPAPLVRADGTRAGELRSAVADADGQGNGCTPGFVGMALVAGDLAPPDGAFAILGETLSLAGPA